MLPGISTVFINLVRVWLPPPSGVATPDNVRHTLREEVATQELLNVSPPHRHNLPPSGAHLMCRVAF